MRLRIMVLGLVVASCALVFCFFGDNGLFEQSDGVNGMMQSAEEVDKDWLRKEFDRLTAENTALLRKEFDRLIAENTTLSAEVRWGHTTPAVLSAVPPAAAVERAAPAVKKAAPAVVPPSLKGECTSAHRGANDFGKAKGRGVLISFFCNSTDIQFYRDLGRYDNGKFAFYLPELLGLCESMAKNSPGVPISVVTDQPALVRTIQGCQFDRIIENAIPLKETAWGEKPATLQQSPYAQTLFLDVDTLVCADLRPIFDFLEDYDIVFAKEPESSSEHAKKKDRFRATKKWEVNSGVMAFNNTVCMRKMWQHVARVQAGGDQHYIKLLSAQSVLREHHEIRPLVVGQEWNVRIGPGSIASFVDGPAKVLHMKKQYFKEITCEKVNAHPYYRLFSQQFGAFQVPIWDEDWNKLKKY